MILAAAEASLADGGDRRLKSCGASIACVSGGGGGTEDEEEVRRQCGTEGKYGLRRDYRLEVTVVLQVRGAN